MNNIAFKLIDLYCAEFDKSTTDVIGVLASNRTLLKG